MSKEELQKLKLADLKKLAEERQIKVSGLKKEEIVSLLCEEEIKEEIKEEDEKAEGEENSEVRFIEKRRDPSLPVEGILTVMEDGYGFIRGENFETGDDNVFVS
ncbi:MAG: hypothetical protein IKR24_02570, partial [Erysipelotrichaceae bacterium]|nr:hypothetical protein [Erysipelotrichaceae bacterium]